KIMQPCAAERQITIQTILPSARELTACPQPSVDGAAIQQALINLIDNAVKHSPPGATVRVSLEFAKSNDGGKGEEITLCRFRVEDQGSGIPPQERERIFERFYRLGSELQRETP